MTDSNGRILRLTMRSMYEMLEFVQLVSDHIGVIAGLDDDSQHWVGVAIRETVINAIKHGNRQDDQKLVTVEFAFRTETSPCQLVISVTDQGEGFVPEEVADPLAPENMLKSSGRGIFFMRSFMDDVVLRRTPEGGMQVQLVKNLTSPPTAFSPQA
jgi:serine/threonine-protein kinase RsbW